MNKSVAFLAFFMLIAFAGFSQTRLQPQHRIAQRNMECIHEGLYMGELTRDEAQRLAYQQRRVYRHAYRAKADGAVTPMERDQLRRHQRAVNRNTYRQRNNNQGN